MARRQGHRSTRKGARSYVVADVPPLDLDGVRTLAIGSVLWLIAFVMLLPFYSSLKENDRVWWLWTCMAGFGIGLCGMQYCKLLRRKREEAEAAEAPSVGRRRA